MGRSSSALLRPLALSMAVAALSTGSGTAAPAFELSASYAPSTALLAGYYACRSGLDFDSFTAQFDVAADGSYTLRGQAGRGRIVMSSADGGIDFDGGPFMSDDTATTYARNVTRL
ncbi:MAG TPA: hypothetical protein VL133_10235, partial [Devosia sp.]|nr:hypothetical protein [Devosia sp.]